MTPPRQTSVILADALAPDGDLAGALAELERRALTEADALALCAAAPQLAAIPQSPALPRSGLHHLTAFFQQVESPEPFAVFRDMGLPCLFREFDARLDDPKQDADDLLFLLKIFALYRTADGMERIVRAARRALHAHSDLWPLIFQNFDAQHPLRQRLANALRDPLPTAGAIGVAYLDLCNDVAAGDELFSHPFASPAGIAMLKGWLAQIDAGLRCSRSAVAAAPFLGDPGGTDLLLIALQHPDPVVQMLGACAAVEMGMEAGVDFLSGCCLDPGRAAAAVKYLRALERADAIPPRALEPDFQATARMCEWLAHPREFGRPPDHIELYDARTLLWPPTRDERPVWLFKYRYDAPNPAEEARSGIGMVGSITFALRGEVNAEMPPEDVYALHCCWELQQRRDPRAPAERSIEAGYGVLMRVPVS